MMRILITQANGQIHFLIVRWDFTIDPIGMPNGQHTCLAATSMLWTSSFSK